MKKRIQMILLGLAVIATNATAKGQAGVYMTATDYTENKLTTNERLRLHDFFGDMPYVTIKNGDRKTRMKKSELYGYKDHDNQTYRFYNNAEYRIAEAGPIYIYARTRKIAQSKGFKVLENLYFSVSPTARIYPLTLDELSIAYRDNERFLDLFYNFTSADDVTAYDQRHHVYKVNYIYAKSVKQ